MSHTICTPLFWGKVLSKLPCRKRRGSLQVGMVDGMLTTTFEYDGLSAPEAQAQVGNRTTMRVDGVETY